MLGWYIPGLLELPTSKPPPFITCRTFPAVLRVLVFIFALSVMFFFRFVCVRVLRARHRGRAQRRRGCQRVLPGRGGVARSAIAVFVPRRRVCLETRGKHEWALSGLHLWSWIEYVPVYEGRSGPQNNIRAVLIFATKLKFTERATPSEHQHCRAGELGPR